LVIGGLTVILLLVLTLPFMIKKVEENLEPFLFVMGILAAIISGKINTHLVLEALQEPIMIASVVLVAGILFFVLKDQFSILMSKLLQKVPISALVAAIVLLLGLLSSVITAIVASIILVEVIFLLPLKRQNKLVICILACFAIGLGATLTPVGEPLATIAISKLDESFFYLFHLLAKYIIPMVVFFALLTWVYTAKAAQENDSNINNQAAMTAEESLIEDEAIEEDTWKSIIIRALKVYLFVMALVFLGEGFEPLIEAYILGLNPQLLYWINMVSAVLDNATLCAAEISNSMNEATIKAILMGLLISGGMLIPGNIPNIISASRLRITSKEWAILGVPLGLAVMAVMFVILFYL
jgi:predicted cation transporter